jgi:hypothetical protein
MVIEHTSVAPESSIAFWSISLLLDEVEPLTIVQVHTVSVSVEDTLVHVLDLSRVSQVVVWTKSGHC